MVDWDFPKTVDEAVKRLISELPLKDKVYIAGLAKDELYLLHISTAICGVFRLNEGNA